MKCHFATDLHGKKILYEKLIDAAVSDKPDAIFLGGDLTPAFITGDSQETFLQEYFRSALRKIKSSNSKTGTEIFVILGNDDLASCAEIMSELDAEGICKYIHGRKVSFLGNDIYGYSFVPPTPFMLKDWEKYDVSRFVDPGCISPEDGYRSVFREPNEIKYSTIRQDLLELKGDDDVRNSIFLFHSPPYKTNLDRVANDGKHHESAPLDLFAGSIAIRRFIEEYRPMITMHGHIHESARLTGSWKDLIGNTVCFGAAHDGPELALIKFDSGAPLSAERALL